MGKFFLIIVLIAVIAAGIMLYQNQPQIQSARPTPSIQSSATPSRGKVLSKNSKPTNTAASTETVTVTSSGFEPQTITINAGGKVTWVNKSGADVSINSNPHPVHTDYPPLNLGIVGSNGSISLIFPSPGTYGYHNHLIPSQKAMVVVK